MQSIPHHVNGWIPLYGVHLGFTWWVIFIDNRVHLTVLVRWPCLCYCIPSSLSQIFFFFHGMGKCDYLTIAQAGLLVEMLHCFFPLIRNGSVAEMMSRNGPSVQECTSTGVRGGHEADRWLLRYTALLPLTHSCWVLMSHGRMIRPQYLWICLD